MRSKNFSGLTRSTRLGCGSSSGNVDVAAETANVAKPQILVQASAAMVAQANTANNVALMLLQ